jgi:hypothetical protein
MSRSGGGALHRSGDAVALEPVEHARQAFFAGPYRLAKRKSAWNCGPCPSRGTEGSNPAPSTGESGANLTSPTGGNISVGPYSSTAMP